MHLLTQSALLKALGWTLFNSLWQMGLLWLAYQLLVRMFSQAPSRIRHGLALSLLLFGAVGSVLTFAAAYFGGEGGLHIPGNGGFIARFWAAEILPYCSSLYLLVLSALLIRYSHQYLHSRRLTRQGLAKIPAQFRVFVEATGRRMGIRRVVRVSLSSLVDVPLALGALKPLILLPVAMISHLTTGQVEAILVHELAHIRRKDLLTNFGVTVIGLLFFFNPFARMLIGEGQKEMEHCCDDEVLQFNYDPEEYVSALLSLARQSRQGRIALAATGGGDQLLLQRARKILQQKRMDRRPGARPFILFFLTAAISVLGLSRSAKTDSQHSPTPVRVPAQVAIRPNGAAAPVSRETVFILIPAARHNVQPGKSARPGNARPGNASPAAAAIARAEAASAATAKADHPAGQAGDPYLSEAGTIGSLASTGDQPMTSTLILIQPATLTITEPAPRRDYSLGLPNEEEQEPAGDIPETGGLVFVPNSSFSFQDIDTLRPEDKLTWIEESTEREIRAQVGRLQRELQAQLEILRRQQDQARTLSISSQQQLKQLLNRQLLLQRDYLKKLDEMHLQFKKAIHHLRTVYI